MTILKARFKGSTFWGTGVVVDGRRWEREQERLVRSLGADLVRYNGKRSLVWPERSVPQPNQAATICEAASSV